MAYYNKPERKDYSDMMQMFSFVDTMTGKKAAARIPINEVHVFRKPRYCCLTLSAELAPEFDRASIKSVRLAKNNFTGDYALVFTSVEDEGHNVLYSGSGNKGRKKTALRVTARGLVEAIFKAFDMPKEADYMELELSENNSRRPDVKFYTIQKI